MQWNPDKYNQFKSFRYRPFFDLVSHISDKPGIKVVDLGCGTGELTNMLANRLTNPTVVGVDSSKEMLEKSKEFEKSTIRFEQKTIQEQINTSEKWDLIFANASIQWIENHRKLIPEIISTLHGDGQLAVQVPAQNENLLNLILLELVQEEPYLSFLGGWKRPSPVLTLDDYAQILFQNGGKEITVYQKVYPFIADSNNDLFELISGSTLIPYTTRLEGEIKQRFIQELKNRIKSRFSNPPVFYAFKRIILYAQF